MSFHGLPRRSLDLGDPYHCQCQKTARLLASRARPRAEAVRGHVPVALRPGRVAEALHAGHAGRGWQGRRRRASTWPVPASSPIASKRSRRSASRCKQAFLGAGGREFHAIPCLNEHPLVDRGAGRPRWSRTSAGGSIAPPDAAARESTRMRAKSAGIRRRAVIPGRESPRVAGKAPRLRAIEKSRPAPPLCEVGPGRRPRTNQTES